METKMRSSWATSAKLHHLYNTEKEQSIATVLTDYGIENDVKDTKNSEKYGMCNLCRNIKPIDNFIINGFKSSVCLSCCEAPEKISSQEAPILAAVRLLRMEPKSLALLIKHFRKEFEKLYNEEKEKLGE